MIFSPNPEIIKKEGFLIKKNISPKPVLPPEWESFVSLENDSFIGVIYDNIRFYRIDNSWISNLITQPVTDIPSHMVQQNSNFPILSGGRQYIIGVTENIITLDEEKTECIKYTPHGMLITEGMYPFLNEGEEVVDVKEVNGWPTIYLYILTNSRIIKATNTWTEEGETGSYVLAFVESINLSGGLIFVLPYYELNNSTYAGIIKSNGDLVTVVMNSTDQLSIYSTISLPTWDDFCYDYGFISPTRLNSTIMALFPELVECIEFIYNQYNNPLLLYSTRIAELTWDGTLNKFVESNSISLIQENPHHLFILNTVRFS
jgi:hypothetical protein